MSDTHHSRDSVDVLIVGAGPSGLMMACYLAQRDISFRIIEKNNRQTNYSGAMFIQARTLEVFEQFGVVEEVMQNGRIVKSISLYYNGKRILRVNISNMGHGLSKFPYLFMLPQWQTEKVLLDYLGARSVIVERNTELATIKHHHGFVHAYVKKESEPSEPIKCKYVVGADGIHSTVRRVLNIPWNGEVNEIPLFVTDCEVRPSTIDKANKSINELFGKAGTELVFALTKKGIAGFFPLSGNSWRIDSVIPDALLGRNNITFYNVTKHFADRINLALQLQHPHWFSVFKSNTYLAGTFQSGRCFLIGDAAHVHTPIGAQGMNTGMQDAHNLAWKLAFVLKHQISAEMLGSYTNERRPVAENLIRSTDRYFDLAINKDFITGIFRLCVFPLVIKMVSPLRDWKKMQRAFFKNISETNIIYGALRNKQGKGGLQRNGLAGKRLPYLTWSDGSGKEMNLHQWVLPNHFILLCFVRYEVEGIDLALENMRKKHEKILRYHIIYFSENTRLLFKKLRMKENGSFLVRPDGYIAMVSGIYDLKWLEDYCNSLYQ